MPELADRGVDAVIGVDEDAPAPDALEDLLARHELAATLDQQEKQIERDAFEMYDAPRMAELVSAPIQLEVFKFEPFRRHLPRTAVCNDILIEGNPPGTGKLQQIFRRSPLSYRRAPARMRVKCARPDQTIVEEGFVWARVDEARRSTRRFPPTAAHGA